MVKTEFLHKLKQEEASTDQKEKWTLMFQTVAHFKIYDEILRYVVQ